ncbi:MAG TPA: hypothetical protein VGZ27_15860 [Vicinamibacterales bacterium]|jgi:hypothetical protein|nr:hypothetical protein [Vicinamibacterales bacterium]
MRLSAMLTGGLLVVAVSGAALIGQRLDVFVASRDHPAIDYSSGPVRDPVSALNRRIEDGAGQLEFEATSGYLRSVLKALEIPIESQVVVFSQTSEQSSQISLRNPRAIFFNDSVMIGWVRGTDHLEVAAGDPRQGVIFYTLGQSTAGKPAFKRDDTCLQCHLTWDTLGVPGVQVLSTFPMSDDPNAYASGFVADHRSPLDQRWGGWYVTGKSVPIRHMGNVPVIQPAAMLAKGPALPPKLESLAGQFDTKAFLSPYSDIVALMVLEHQTHMTNLLTRIGWEMRLSSYEAQKTHASEVTDRVRSATRDLVDYLLFVDETPVTSRLQGSSGFAEKFSAEGPRDSLGRSLRQLDLERRLMRYPCSYMIYSSAFDALPDLAKDLVYKRMWQILSGEEKEAPYTRLSLADRQAIVQILRETKKGLPEYFRPLTR